MRRAGTLLSAAAAVVVALGLVVGVAAGATPGAVVYSLQFSANGVSNSYTITETVSTTSNASSDSLLLEIASSAWAINYSRVVNSSLELQPFLPAISNQSFAYSMNGTRLAATIVRSGTTPITFEGGAYSLSVYSYSIQISGSAPPLGALNLTAGGAPGTSYPPTPLSYDDTLNGTISAFPSGLVYSVNGSVQGDGSFSITLLSTTLPLGGASSSATVQAASIGVGAGATVSALALGLGVRARKSKQKPVENKPEHWVD